MNKQPRSLAMAIAILWMLVAVDHLIAQQDPADLYEPPPLSVEFLPEAGFYEDTVELQLLSPGAAIYYSADGTKPQISSRYRYTTPIRVTRTTSIRAIAVLAGERSRLFSNTYFIGEPESSLPVVSVSITPSILFDPVRGLFRRGTNVIDSLWYLPGANFWSKREATANVELFDQDGKMVWGSLTGFRLFGGMSRLFPQKSISIVARNRYGDKRIRYKVFGKKGLKKFKYLVLRNSGSDFGKTHFRDALLTHLVRRWDLDVQDYQPANVYINGTYWGIYNLREKINSYFVAAHHGVDKDSIDLLEHKITRRNGSTRHYRELLKFLRENSLADPVNFAWVSSQMEVNNFMDYQIAQIYFDNQDAGGNIRFWRPQTATGRWRWILYDTDWGFGLNDPKAFRNNSVAFHTAPDGPRWPNPPWSTFILRKLLENREFEREFVTRFCDYLNDDLQEEKVLSAIDAFYKRLLPEMPRHLECWGKKKEEWEAHVDILRTFARERPAYIREFLMKEFAIGDLRTVTVEVTKGGKAIVNESIKVRDRFSGKYFEKTPLRLLAKADLGYRFVRWEGDQVNSESAELLLELSRPYSTIKAVFEKFEHPLASRVIINEISCNNKKSGDWVEIYNNTRERVNLRGWILADTKNEFVFPTYVLPPKGYVVVCEDSTDFIKLHPGVQSLIGGLSFGLNKRQETIQLFSPEAAAVDSLAYELEPMDSVFALNLLLPSLDNGNPDNWEVVRNNGSPGAANLFYLTSSIQQRRSLWMQTGGALGLLVICIMLLRLRARKISG